MNGGGDTPAPPAPEIDPSLVEGLSLNEDAPIYNTYVSAIFSPDSLENSRLIAELVETDTQFGLDVYSLTADGETPGEGTTFYRRKYRQTKSEIPDVETLEDYWQHIGGASMRNVTIDGETYEIGGGDTPAFIFMRAEKAIEWLKQNTGEDYTIYDEPEPATPVRLTTIEEESTRVLAVEFSDSTTKVVVLGDATRAIECAVPTDAEPVRMMFYPTPATTATATRNVGTLSEDTIVGTITKASNDKAATLQIEGIDKTWLLWSLYDTSPCAVNPSCTEPDTPKGMRLGVLEMVNGQHVLSLVYNDGTQASVGLSPESKIILANRGYNNQVSFMCSSDIATEESVIRETTNWGQSDARATYTSPTLDCAATLQIENFEPLIYLWPLRYSGGLININCWQTFEVENKLMFLAGAPWTGYDILCAVYRKGEYKICIPDYIQSEGIVCHNHTDGSCKVSFSPTPATITSYPLTDNTAMEMDLETIDCLFTPATESYNATIDIDGISFNLWDIGETSPVAIIRQT